MGNINLDDASDVPEQAAGYSDALLEMLVGALESCCQEFAEPSEEIVLPPMDENFLFQLRTVLELAISVRAVESAGKRLFIPRRLAKAVSAAFSDASGGEPSWWAQVRPGASGDIWWFTDGFVCIRCVMAPNMDAGRSDLEPQIPEPVGDYVVPADEIVRLSKWERLEELQRGLILRVLDNHNTVRRCHSVPGFDREHMESLLQAFTMPERFPGIVDLDSILDLHFGSSRAALHQQAFLGKAVDFFRSMSTRKVGLLKMETAEGELPVLRLRSDSDPRDGTGVVRVEAFVWPQKDQ